MFERTPTFRVYTQHYQLQALQTLRAQIGTLKIAFLLLICCFVYKTTWIYFQVSLRIIEGYKEEQ